MCVIFHIVFVFGVSPAKTVSLKETKQSKRMNSHPEKRRAGRIPNPPCLNRHPMIGEQ